MPTATKPAVSHLQAVCLALAAYTFWVLTDTSFKIAGTSALPAYEVAGLVGYVIALLLFFYALCRGELRALWPRQPVRQFQRALLELANAVCVVIALRHMPLALFYILIFFSPMVTTGFAALLLGEPLEWRKALAIFAGFLGVVVAVNPFGVTHPGDWTGYLACFVCVTSFSANTLLSRVLTRTESPLSLTFFSGAVLGALGLAATIVHGAPLTVRVAPVLAAAGIFGVFGSLCFFQALRHAPASTVSQYHYSQLLTGALLAYLLWHEKLTAPMLLGAVLIVAAGVYTAAATRAPQAAAELLP